VAGNRRHFERAMKRAKDHVERHEWSKAVAQYEQALAEFSDDLSALSGLAQVYLNTQQLEKALAIYQQVRQGGADAPPMLERMADTQERLGRLEEAADTYVTLADHALQEREIDRAIHFWKRATQLASGHPIARLNLAKAYVSQGRAKRAIKEYLALARAFQREGRLDQAMNICQQALMLDPRNTQVLSLMGTLRDLLEPAVKPETDLKPLSKADLEALSFEDEPSPSSRREEGSPVDMAQQRAFGALAEAVFEEDLVKVIASRPSSSPALTKRQIDTLIGQALDFERQGLVNEGVAVYERLLNAGIDRPEVHFNLGLLYQEKRRWDDAVHHLSMAQTHQDYKLGALFAVGECYRAQGKVAQALTHFLEVLKLVDLTTVRPDQADDLNRLYEGLTDGYAKEGGSERARRFTNSLVQFLGSKDWEEKVKKTRECLDSIAGEGELTTLAEIVGVPGSEAILKSMVHIQELARKNKVTTALEEAYGAIRVSPFYLPLHLQLGDIFLGRGRFSEATDKFLMVAHLYQVRGDARAAIDVYHRLLRASPMDVTVRTSLVDLLVSRGDIDDALNEYLALGEAYFQLAQVNKALEKYNEAIRLSRRGSDEAGWTTRFLHCMGDIYLQRVDWRRAFEIYQRIKKISSYDERACLNMIDLYYKMGHSRKGLAELDALVGHFYKNQKFEKAIAILQNAVQMWPEEEAVRFRLAQAHLSRGNKEEAVAELDALGDLQLKAGHTDRAIETIRSIIKINPPNVDSYRQLLSQIGGQRL
jgi:tetratricopeptide (TPR) repeat protein